MYRERCCHGRLNESVMRRTRGGDLGLHPRKLSQAYVSHGNTLKLATDLRCPLPRMHVIRLTDWGPASPHNRFWKQP